MARTRNSVQTRNRHKKWLKRAKGYRGRRSKVFKIAKEAVLKAGQHAYHDRRKKKSVKRQEWQATINTAAREHGLSYSKLIHGLRKANIELNKKMLAELAVSHPEAFKKVVETAEAGSEETKK